ncbi:MAG TPA: beta-propeller domain-containing protein [Candidatus Paceibacterota bacterium]|nr:beta-propeller domain-containing protein [Candidatus Paceibacterota bacterium]
MSSLIKSNQGSALLIGLIVGIVAVVFLFIGIGLYIFWPYLNQENPFEPNTNVTEIKQFSSYDEITDFLKNSRISDDLYTYGSAEMFGGVLKSSSSTSSPTVQRDNSESAGASSVASDYSTTNIQVEGVDEADIVKNDGKYIYTVLNGNVVIVEAFPADSMKIVSQINISNVNQIFINDEKLITFSNGYEQIEVTPMDSVVSVDTQLVPEDFCYDCGRYSITPKTNIFIYDISDRKNPILIKNVSVDGSYGDSRMIGNYVYLISNKYIQNYNNPDFPVYSVDGVKNSLMPNDIYYFDYVDYSYVYTLVSALEIDGNDFESKAYLTGSTDIIYVSQDNVYLTSRKRTGYKEYFDEQVKEVYLKILPTDEKIKVNVILASSKSNSDKLNEISELVKDYSDSLTGDEKADFDKSFMEAQENFNVQIEKKRDKTVIGKINIDKDKIKYVSTGEVPGNVLNQFSMDEYNGNFRIATTTGDLWNGNSLNHLYILNNDLEIIGKVEDLAHGERIYSARFMGNRAYIVTFKKIDPLFVIDVKDPENPKVLGYLKITGYSDYLHPYDENHIIGVGKETAAPTAEESAGRNIDFAWYQGVKVSLFDVSDVENPKEVGKIVIGDRGTDSLALQDHKAFLLDKKRNMLVMPITLAEINKTKYRNCSAEETSDYRSYEYCLTDHTYGEQVWNGAYVLNIDLEGISVKGKITHTEEYTGIRYGAARDEPIGAKRIDSIGNVWIKYSLGKEGEYRSYYGSGEWRAENLNSIRSDYEVDNFPGGVDYVENLKYGYGKQIQRSLYMDDVLYTVSQSKIKANEISDLSELNSVKLPFTNYGYYPEY